MIEMIEFTGTKEEIQACLNHASPVSVAHGVPAFKKKWSKNHDACRVWFEGDDIKVNDLARAIREAAGLTGSRKSKPAPVKAEDKPE